MKRLIVFLTLVMLILGIVACDDSDSSTNQSTGTSSSPNGMTVEFDSCGGTPVDSIIVEKGEKISKPQDPTRDGYTFVGWYVDGEEWSFIGYTVTANMTLEAKWEPNTYVIRYVGADNPFNKKKYTPEDEFDLLPGAKTYCDFLGWYEDAKFTKPITKIEKGRHGDLTLYAKTAIQTVKVSFDFQNGSPVKTIEVGKGSCIEAPANPTRDGYIFEGWYCGENEWLFDTFEVTKEAALTAKWKTIDYTITYVGATGSQFGYTVEDELVLENGTKEYCDFLGWYEDEGLTKPITKIEKGTFGNLTLYAKTQRNGSEFSYYTKKNGELEVYDIKNTELTYAYIPSTYEGRAVTSIRNQTFVGCGSLTELVIPSSITSIGGDILHYCHNLKCNEYKGALYLGNEENPYVALIDVSDKNASTYEIHESTKIIGYSAFGGCKNLSSIEIPSQVVTIENRAFSTCEKLRTIVIPDSVRNMGTEVFLDCGILTEATLSNGISIIPNSSFKGCKALRGIQIPKSVAIIEDYAFADCISLESIVIPKTVEYMGSHVFKGCTSAQLLCEADSKPLNWYDNWNSDKCKVLWGYSGETGVTGDGFIWMGYEDGISIVGYEGNSSNVVIPSTINGRPVVKIGTRVFEGIIVESVSIPNSVTTILEYAFEDNIFLKSLRLPRGVISIGKGAFYNCRNLETVEIPSSVESIGADAFYGSSAMIFCGAASAPSGWNQSWKNSKNTVLWNYRGENGKTDDFKWALMEGGITIIKYVGSSTEIVIPSTINNNPVNEIYKSAFANLSAVTSVSLPDTLTTIQTQAFYGCSALEKIVIPISVTKIESSVFFVCDKLTIYCEAESEPDGWGFNWYSSRPVEWGYVE